MKKLISVCMIMMGLMILGLNQAVASSDPVATVQTLADEMIANLKANKATLKTNRSLVYSLAYRIVVPHADLDEMSKRVVAPQVWRSASPAERDEFKKLFTRRLVQTYSSALADYNDQTIRFFPTRGRVGNEATVKSQIIRSDGPALDVSYRVILNGSEWQLLDISVEGVSLLKSWRDQLSSQGNMQQLLQYLKQRNAR